MPGLIDSDTGLAFGIGLQWQTAIGGGGFVVVTIPNGEMITEDSINMITEDSQYMIVEA